jgi:RHS repeat-associated protein
MENMRVWYNYPGQGTAFNSTAFEGSSAAPTAIGRALDNGTSQVSKATYNALSKPLTRTDPLGRVTRFTYASNNVDLVLVEQKTGATAYSTIESYGTYNSQHRPASITNAAGQTWSYSYNTDGQVTAVTNPLNQVTTYNYDALGRLASVTNANNATAITITYLTNCETENPDHINCDLPISITDSEGRTVSYSRDALDRVRVITYPDSTVDQFNYTNLHLTSRVDRLGRTTTYSYDANRRLASVTDPLNNTVQYAYYDNDVLKSITDQNGSAHTTTWSIDLQSRVTAKTFADSSSIAYVYDSASRLKTATDALGQVKAIGYDAANSVTSVTHTSTVNPTPDVTFVYDPYFRRATSMSTSGVGTTTWTYRTIGAAGALWLQTDDGPFANDAVTYSYDQLGRVSSMTVGDTTTEEWAYDAIGRVSSHVTALGTFAYAYLGETHAAVSRSLSGTSFVTNWSYDTNANDRRLLSIAPNGGARTFTYGHRIGASTTIDPYQITSIVQTASALPAETWCYDYDDAGRLIDASNPTVTGTDCTQAQTTQYGFVVDAAGNHTTFAPSSGNSTSRSYNNLNQMVTTGASTVTYDANGNRTGDSSGTYFKWDAEDRVIEIGIGTTLLASYVYDGLGRRLQITYPTGSPIRYSWCGRRVCAKRIGDLTNARYFEEGTYYSLGTKQVVIKDHLGSLRDHIDVQTGAVGSYDYTPFGAVAASAGPAGAVFLYGGLQLDTGVANYQYSATRTYDAGRWLNRDPIAEAGGVNLYAHVAGDPIDFYDDLGEMKLPADPSGLGPDWQLDPTHTAPNRQRYRHPSGDILEFDKAQPGEPPNRWSGRDHWHHNGEKKHRRPGTEVPDPQPVCDAPKAGSPTREGDPSENPSERRPEYDDLVPILPILPIPSPFPGRAPLPVFIPVLL